MLTEPVALLAEDLGNYLHCSSGNALRSPLRHPRFTALGQADFETAFRNAAAISRLAHPRLLCSARPVGVLRPGRGRRLHRPPHRGGGPRRRRLRLPSGPALPAAAPGSCRPARPSPNPGPTPPRSNTRSPGPATTAGPSTWPASSSPTDPTCATSSASPAPAASWPLESSCRSGAYAAESAVADWARSMSTSSPLKPYW
jgi:hypothetical protein